MKLSHGKKNETALHVSSESQMYRLEIMGKDNNQKYNDKEFSRIDESQIYNFLYLFLYPAFHI